MVKKKAAKAAKKKAPKLGTRKVRQDKARRKAKTAGFNGARARKRAAKTGGKSKGPVQQELIKGVRYGDLDRLCRHIGDNRDETARLTGEGADLSLKAIKSMRVHGVTAYKYAGITLMIVPGDEKLRILKDRGGKASSGEGAPAHETGEGQDPAAIGEALTEGEGAGED